MVQRLELTWVKQVKLQYAMVGLLGSEDGMKTLQLQIESAVMDKLPLSALVQFPTKYSGNVQLPSSKIKKECNLCTKVFPIVVKFHIFNFGNGLKLVTMESFVRKYDKGVLSGMYSLRCNEIHAFQWMDRNPMANHFMAIMRCLYR